MSQGEIYIVECISFLPKPRAQVRGLLRIDNLDTMLFQLIQT